MKAMLAPEEEYLMKAMLAPEKEFWNGRKLHPARPQEICIFRWQKYLMKAMLAPEEEFRNGENFALVTKIKIAQKFNHSRIFKVFLITKTILC